MKATRFIAAAAVFAAAGSAFAGDAPAATAAATGAANSAVLASAANTGIAAQSLNVPTITIAASSGRSRAEVRAEAVEFVKNYKTTMQVQLDQYKN